MTVSRTWGSADSDLAGMPAEVLRGALVDAALARPEGGDLTLLLLPARRFPLDLVPTM